MRTLPHRQTTSGSFFFQIRELFSIFLKKGRGHLSPPLSLVASLINCFGVIGKFVSKYFQATFCNNYWPDYNKNFKK